MMGCGMGHNSRTASGIVDPRGKGGIVALSGTHIEIEQNKALGAGLDSRSVDVGKAC